MPFFESKYLFIVRRRHIFIMRNYLMNIDLERICYNGGVFNYIYSLFNSMCNYLLIAHNPIKLTTTPFITTPFISNAFVIPYFDLEFDKPNNPTTKTLP